MQVKRVIVLGVVLASLLAGCATDPRNEAEAYKIRILADQAAADQAAARVERQATSAARVAGWNRFIPWLAVAGCLAIIGVSVGVSWAAVGSGRAVARFAELRAGLIPLAESTRQFPLVASYVGKGLITLANPNTGAVVYLDTHRDEQRGAMAAAGAVQLAGVVAREARRSNDAAGLAVIPGQVVELAEVVEIGGKHE
jgi:hypothetical protein